MKQLFFGIDLGTTYSSIAFISDNDESAHPISDRSNYAVPSVVFFNTIGTPIVGAYAKSRLRIKDNAERTIKEFKLEMGEDFCKEEILTGPINSSMTRKVSPVEASACVLNHMMRIGLDHALNNGITAQAEAVITVPAGFSFKQRAFTKLAAQLAGIKVIGLLQEPTAAALAHNIKDGETVLVFDLGGGTLDVSIVRHIGKRYEVLGVASDTEVLDEGKYLGGKDWDEIIVKLALQGHEIEYQDISRNEKAYLLDEAEKRKIELSDLSVPCTDFVFSDNTIKTISRTEFERNCQSLLKNCIQVVKSAIQDAKNKLGSDSLILDRFLLVGGSSNMPMIRKAFDKVFSDEYSNGKDSSVWMRVSNRPETSIAEGAALYARLLKNGHKIDDVLYVNDRSQCSYGTSKLVNNKRCIQNIIKKNENMLVSEKVFRFRTHVDNQRIVFVDIYENNSIEDTINIDESTKKIYDEVYEIDHYVPKRTPVIFRVSRDCDGLIKIKVAVAGCPQKEFNADTSVTIKYTIEEQTKESIKLLRASYETAKM